MADKEKGKDRQDDLGEAAGEATSSGEVGESGSDDTASDSTASDGTTSDSTTSDDTASDSAEDAPTEESAEEASTLEEQLLMASSTVMGILTIHFAERDVDFLIDGASALRMLATFARGRDRGDYIDPVHSPQRAMWVVADLQRALAMTWWPRLPAPRTRTAIDPPLPAEAA